MRNNNLKMTLLLLVAATTLSCTDSQEAANESAPSIKVEVLERWDVNDATNVALLVLDTLGFDKEAALLSVAENCGPKCNVAYFYAKKEAYELHAISRTNFGNPNLHFNGDVKRMVEAHKKWKEEDSHWKQVQDNLIATVSFGEFEPYPYR